MSLIWFSIKYCYKHSKSRLWIEIFLNIFKQFFNVFYGVYFIRLLLYNLEKQNTINFNSIFILILMLFLNFTFWLLKLYCDNIYFPKSDIKINERITMDIADKIINIPYQIYNNPENLDKCYRIIQNVSERIIIICSSCGAFTGHIFALIMISVYVTQIDIISIIISFIPFIILIIIGKVMSNLNYMLDKSTTISERKKSYARRVFYLPQYAKEIKLTRISDEIKKIYNDGVDISISARKKIGFKLAFFSIIESFFGDAFILTASLLYVVLKMISGTTLLIGDFVGISQAISFFNWNLTDLSLDIRSLNESIPYIKEFKEFIKSQSDVKNISFNDVENYELCFNNVSFYYDKNKPAVLKNINLKIKEGDKIAIVGENGAGKSTLINLILGLYSPTYGEIKLNNINLDKYKKNDLNSFFAVLFQHFNIYPFTIKENITMGNSDISDSFIENLMTDIGLERYLEKLNFYYTSEFDKNGIVLSGGQQQRLAFMRILCSNIPFIILDEPTSAVDVLSEEKLYRIIAEKNPEKTIVFISHKFSTTTFVDKIIFLKDGEIKEFGSHEELMNMQGDYYRLYEMQANKYKINL